MWEFLHGILNGSRKKTFWKPYYSHHVSLRSRPGYVPTPAFRKPPAQKRWHNHGRIEGRDSRLPNASINGTYLASSLNPGRLFEVGGLKFKAVDVEFRLGLEFRV